MKWMHTNSSLTTKNVDYNLIGRSTNMSLWTMFEPSKFFTTYFFFTKYCFMFYWRFEKYYKLINSLRQFIRLMQFICKLFGMAYNLRYFTSQIHYSPWLAMLRLMKFITIWKSKSSCCCLELILYKWKKWKEWKIEQT